MGFPITCWVNVHIVGLFYTKFFCIMCRKHWSDAIVNTNGGNPCIDLITSRILTLRTNMIFIQTPKISRKIATTQFGFVSHLCNKCVFHILQELGCGNKIVRLILACLSRVFFNDLIDVCKNIQGHVWRLRTFQTPITNKQRRVLNSFTNMSIHLLFSLKLYYMMRNMVLSILLFYNFLLTSILYHDNVNTMAYVVDMVFSLGTHIMDRGLVLNMWWIGHV